MSGDTSLRIERLIDAPIERVFRAWTTREGMEHWYQDRPDDVVRVVELELRVGGRYRVEFGPRGEPPYVESGVYLEVDPPHRLVMTEALDGPGGPQWSETTVTVVFEADGDKTRLVLVHESFPAREQRDNASLGWPGFLDRLERVAISGS